MEVYKSHLYHGCLTAKRKYMIYSFSPEKTGSYELIIKSDYRVSCTLVEDLFEVKDPNMIVENKDVIKMASTFLLRQKYFVKIYTNEFQAEEINFKFMIKYISVPEASYFKYQWGLQNRTNGLDINIVPMWEYIRRSDVRIGVVDTGIDFENIYIKKNINRELSYDFTNTMRQDIEKVKCAHGTHVAGVIAAYPIGNIGMVGVVDNSNVISLRILDENNKNEECIINKASDAFVQAIKYAKKNNIRILNCSFSGKSFSQNELNAMENSKDILFVLAAGNDGLNLDEEKRYPACYEMENSIVVAAMNKEGKLYETSNYGSCIDIVAPGENIVGTYEKEHFIKANGTSVAAPFVSGVCSLLMQQYSCLTPIEIKKIIVNRNNTTRISESKRLKHSCGLLNAYKSFQYIQYKNGRETP